MQGKVGCDSVSCLQGPGSHLSNQFYFYIIRPGKAVCAGCALAESSETTPPEVSVCVCVCVCVRKQMLY